MDNEKTGKLIYEARLQKGLTQQQLAERLHVTNKAVSKWERGLSFPGVDLLQALAEALGLTVTELLAGERVPAESACEKADHISVQALQKELHTRRLCFVCGAVCVLLALCLFLSLFGRPLFQRGNPLPYLFASAKLLDGRPFAEVNDREGVYIAKRGPCPELLEQVAREHEMTFAEQAGSGFIFTDGKNRLVVSCETYLHFFTVWTVPCQTLESP